MSDRRWRELVVDTDSTVWNREKPIEGTFVKVESEVGPKKSKLYTIKTTDGEIKVWGSTVLDDKLLGVPEGAYLKIEYTGKERGKSGNEYHTYKVFIDDDSLKHKDTAIEGESIPLDQMPDGFLQ